MKLFFFFPIFFVSMFAFSQQLLTTQGNAVFVPASDSTPALAQLTAPVQYAYGAVYLGSQQNLNQAIVYEFDILLGQNDGGADGMVFFLHNDTRGQLAHGDVGMGLGYASSPNTQDHMNGFSSFVSNSIAVEFDTYQNSNKSDPSEDHVAFVSNGNNKHSDYPASYTKKIPNVEDGQFHRFRFEWNPAMNRVKVYLDNMLRLDISTDIRTLIGGSVAYIGFSATTGALVNTQSVRDVSSPMPVELSGFYGQYHAESQSAELRWSTLSETNNSHFVIERSGDGFVYETIGLVSGSGNSNAPVDYSFLDRNFSGDVVYYRLTQVDFDGKSESFPVLAVTRQSNPDAFEVISAFASEGRLQISMKHEQDAEYSVAVFATDGRKLMLEREFLSAGRVSLDYSLSEIEQGQMFLVQLTRSGAASRTIKLLMQ